MQRAYQVLRDAAHLWYDKDADHLAAMVSYYAIYAMTPLLLLIITIISLIYGNDLALTTLLKWGSVLGGDVEQMLYNAVKNLMELSNGYALPVLGTFFFSWMVVVMLNTFTSGLHHLWGIPHRGLRGWLKKSCNSLIFLVVFQVYLLFLFGFSNIISYFVDATGWFTLICLQALFFLITTAILFSVAYRMLPWEAPPLRARLIGGAIASILFTIAKGSVALYVERTPTPDLYEAAGIIIVLLIWIYVTVSIMYYGAAVAHIIGKQRV